MTKYMKSAIFQWRNSKDRGNSIKEDSHIKYSCWLRPLYYSSIGRTRCSDEGRDWLLGKGILFEGVGFCSNFAIDSDTLVNLYN